MNLGLAGAGLAVGMLVGLTGMGAGSLMTPLLISVFGIPASTAVGTDLIYACVTKTFGAARHTQLRNVNRELALWMGVGSVPAALVGVYSLYHLFGDNINSWLPNAIGYALVLVGIAVAIRTFVTVRGINFGGLPKDGPLNGTHKAMAVAIGLVFGFILGLTSVGAGVFFGMTLVLLFPLSARRVVGTDIMHGALVTTAAAAGTILWGHPNYGYVGTILIGSIPGILIGSHFTSRMHERALRGGIATVLSLSGLKLLGAW